jgi:hypothetical protein
MKYIKSINESKTSDIIDYIKFCFSDIIEDDNFNSDYTIHSSGNILRIGIEMITPLVSGNSYIGQYETSIDDLLSNNKLIEELLLDIDSAIKRFKDEYNHIQVDISSNRIKTIYISFNLIKKIKPSSVF